MKKLPITIGAFIIVGLSWLLVAQPALLFGGDIVMPIQEEEPTYFAELDADGIVLRVIVADRAFIDSGAVGDPEKWVQTDIDGRIRKNYAGIGYKYDPTLDVFTPPSLDASVSQSFDGLNDNGGASLVPPAEEIIASGSIEPTLTPTEEGIASDSMEITTPMPTEEVATP